MTEEQAVAWLILEGFRLFRDPADDDLRWCSESQGSGVIPRTWGGRRTKDDKFAHPYAGVEWSGIDWDITEFTELRKGGVKWIEEPIEAYACYAPAVVKLLLEEAPDEP